MPRADVAPGVLQESTKTTRCPLKGRAAYFSVAKPVAGGKTAKAKAGKGKKAKVKTIKNAVWAYPDPLPSVPWISEVCF